MKSDGIDYWAKQVGLAFGLAIAASVVAFPACCGCLGLRFDREYPHDGQNALGAFVFAFPGAGLFGFIVLSVMLMRAFLRRRKELTAEADAEWWDELRTSSREAETVNDKGIER